MITAHLLTIYLITCSLIYCIIIFGITVLLCRIEKKIQMVSQVVFIEYKKIETRFFAKNVRGGAFCTALPPKQSRLTNSGWACNYQLCLTSAINTPDQSAHLRFLCGNVSYCPARGGTSPHTAATSVNYSRDRNAPTSSSGTVSPNPPCLCRCQGSRKE